MIVNHAFKFIFLKTRKTAGTSVELALSRYCGTGDIVTPLYREDEAVRTALGFCGPQNCDIPRRHYAWRDWLRALRGKPARLKNHSVAALVKRTVGDEIFDSYFKFAIERNPFDKAISRYYWNTRDDAQKGEFSEVLAKLSPRQLSSWDVYSIDDSIVVDRVLRYENLSAELEEVRRAIGLPEPLDLPRAKGSHRREKKHYSELLDPACRALIEARCAREIEAFGYAWSDG